MNGAIFWGASLRVAQAVVLATPTILVGLAVAGVLRRLLGPENTRRLFGCGTWRELPQAWLIGMLLPVCSLGVIPIAREMRRARIKGGTILAFAMTAPLFNPLSMLYGLTLSEPFVILSFAFCTMVVLTLVGAAFNRLIPDTVVAGAAEPPVAYGLRRMASIVVVAAREVVGPSLGYALIALGGVAALSAILSPGRLGSTMEHENPYAPLAMVAVAIPAYTSPLVAMSQIGSMFQHANSVGAAFVLTLGAGVNLGLIAWVWRTYGVARGAAWLAILVSVVLSLAYAIENPLYPREIEPPGHTHAFDIYCRPFDSGGTRDLAPIALAKLREEIDPIARVGLIVLATLAVVGLALRGLDRRWRVEDWLERQPSGASTESPGWANASIPPPVLGGIALAGLVVFSVIGCFAYYPAPQEVFEEMKILRGEVLSAALSGNQKHAAHFIPVWDDWTRRLQVGTFLREGQLGPYRRIKAKVFRDRLEFLKHAVEEGDREEAREMVASVQKAYDRMRQVYLEPKN